MRLTRIATFSPGITQIPGITRFLGCDELILRPRCAGAAGLDAVAGWGLKPNTAAARAYAARHGLPYLHLEDGFLRSVGHARGAAGTFSLVVDGRGIYYDPSRPSMLEDLLRRHPFAEDVALMEQARQCLDYFRDLRASKYNAGDPWTPPARRAAQRILVLGQIEEDESVRHGAPAGTSNLHLARTALAEHPDAEIWYKPHPDIALGLRPAPASEAAIAAFARILPPGTGIAELAPVVDRVYTITSLGGFEALLHGTPVTTIGCPFYAGWGVTDDRMACPRRDRRLSVEQIFAAAYVLYPRYLDPCTGARCGLERILDAIEAQQRARQENGRPTYCLGVSGWKHAAVRDFLGHPSAPVRFRAASDITGTVAAAKRDGARIVAWASKEPPGLEAACRAEGVPLARMEDGFLRSHGLGVDLLRPGSLSIDPLGIHYDASRPSLVERILEEGEIPAWAVRRAAALRERLVASRVGKYGRGTAGFAWPEDDRRKRVLVVGQVEDDASLRRGSPAVTTNLALLRQVRAENPSALIAFKPHPDVLRGLRKGAVPELPARELADLLILGASAYDAILGADEVQVMTSGLGLEALLAGRHVVCHGLPFYAGWGLTEDRIRLERRTRRRSLDELVAAAYLLYPRYVDPVTRLPCGPEVILERILDLEPWPRAKRPVRWGLRLHRLWRSLTGQNGRRFGLAIDDRPLRGGPA